MENLTVPGHEGQPVRTIYYRRLVATLDNFGKSRPAHGMTVQGADGGQSLVLEAAVQMMESDEAGTLLMHDLRRLSRNQQYLEAVTQRLAAAEAKLLACP